MLVGDLDIVDCQARAAELAERIPAARLEVPPGTAHLPHLEAHPGCLAAITAFLRNRAADARHMATRSTPGCAASKPPRSFCTAALGR